MSQKCVEMIFGKLATDEELRRRFRRTLSARSASSPQRGVRADARRARGAPRDEVRPVHAAVRGDRSQAPEGEPAPGAAAARLARRRKEAFVIRSALAALARAVRRRSPPRTRPSRSRRPRAPAGVALTLADATARALARNNDIAFERESFHITDASLLRADGSYDPTFRLDARYRNHTDPANSLLSGAPAGEISPSSEGVSGSAGIGALLPTGGTVSLSASGARDLTNNFLVLLSPSYSTSLGIDLRQPLLQNLSIDPARRAIRIAASTRSAGRPPSAARSRTPSRTSSARTGPSSRRAATSSCARRASASPPNSVTTRNRRSTSARFPSPTSRSLSPSSSAARATSTPPRSRCAAPSSLLKLLLLNDERDPLWNQTIEPVDAPETPVVPVDLASAIEGPRRSGPSSPRRSVRVAAARRGRRLLAGPPQAAARPRRGLRAPRPRGRPEPERPGRGLPGRARRRARRAGGRIRAFARDRRRRPLSRRVDRPLSHGTRLQPRREEAMSRSRRRRKARPRSSSRSRGSASRSRSATRSSRSTRPPSASTRRRPDAPRPRRSSRAEKERYGVGLSTNFFVLTRQNDLSTGRPHGDRRADRLPQSPDRLRARGRHASRRAAHRDPERRAGREGRRKETERMTRRSPPSSSRPRCRARRLRLLARAAARTPQRRIGAGANRGRRGPSRAGFCRASSRSRAPSPPTSPPTSRPNATGRLRAYASSAGATSKKAPILATLDDREAKAQLDQARANLAWAKAEVERYAELRRRQVVARAEDQRKATDLDLAAAVPRARRERLHGLHDPRAVLRASSPRRRSRRAPTSEKGSPICGLVKIDPLRAELAIPEAAVSAVQVGQKAALAAQSFPDRAFDATVRYIGPSLRCEARTLVVEAMVPNPGTS